MAHRPPKGPLDQRTPRHSEPAMGAWPSMWAGPTQMHAGLPSRCAGMQLAAHDSPSVPSLTMSRRSIGGHVDRAPISVGFCAVHDGPAPLPTWFLIVHRVLHGSGSADARSNGG